MQLLVLKMELGKLEYTFDGIRRMSRKHFPRSKRKNYAHGEKQTALLEVLDLIRIARNVSRKAMVERRKFALTPKRPLLLL